MSSPSIRLKLNGDIPALSGLSNTWPVNGCPLLPFIQGLRGCGWEARACLIVPFGKDALCLTKFYFRANESMVCAASEKRAMKT